MPKLRVVLCDDEPLALDRLSSLLSQIDDVELVGAFLSGPSLLQELATTQADLLLLDIEMPQMDGFDVVETLSCMNWSPAFPPPLIVFATARPEFAADAFEFGALDFICKPVRLGRLQQALDRSRRAIDQIEARSRLEELSAQLEALKNAHARQGDARCIWVTSGKETIRVDVDDISWVGAEGEYIRLHAGERSFLERGSLQEAETALKPFGFIRVHRSSVVNIQQIATAKKGAWGQLLLKLLSGDELPVGKKYRHAIVQLTKNKVTSVGSEWSDRRTSVIDGEA